LTKNLILKLRHVVLLDEETRNVVMLICL